MSEKGIIFDAESIEGIIDGRKTMTRRVAKKLPWMNPSIHAVVYDRHPFSPSAFNGTPGEGIIGGEDRYAWCVEDAWGNGIGVEELDWLKCPYGLPGDFLYVKETWASPSGMVGYGFPFWYAADNSILCVGSNGLDGLNINRGKWKSPMYMPRVAARIWLKIEGIRLEPLQRITEDDCYLEGMDDSSATPLSDFANRWDLINRKRGYGWDTNPWVWVITFSVDKIKKTKIVI